MDDEEWKELRVKVLTSEAADGTVDETLNWVLIHTLSNLAQLKSLKRRWRPPSIGM
ncbi:MAG TPA: hypothetical protein VKB04_11780 [Anaerolineales bacterium]|nr:hypothetical protein [Anaerolineales bacterium]